jgi:hypothetical protein
MRTVLPQGVARACESWDLWNECSSTKRQALWELRTTISRAQYWRAQGRRTEAHNLLAQIYGWFSEGYDTPDLKAAKALLQSLDT